MDADEILAQARGTDGTTPDGWSVFPLLKGKLIWGIVGWVLGSLMGLGLLIAIGPIVIPYNYQHGVFSIVFTSILLGILAFILIGSLAMLIADVFRLNQPEKHLIVLTKSDFVKREGNKTTLVPLASIRHVTPRGRAPIDRSVSSETTGVRSIQSAGENVISMIFGRGVTESTGQQQKRKRVRTPTSLAFIDERTDTEVTIVNDNAYGDPYTIAAVLKQYVQSARSGKKSS